MLILSTKVQKIGESLLKFRVFPYICIVDISKFVTCKRVITKNKGANMNKLILLSLIAVMMPLASVAQDDIYFVPTKENVAKSESEYGVPRNTYYSGTNRSVDEYNRYRSNVQPIDSAGNDVIDFDGTTGAYPDSLYNPMSDYQYTRNMNRFDDYSWVDPYWAGYYAGSSSYWRWNDPWFYSSYYYDPWYYGMYGSWYSPWYYSWYPRYNYWYGGSYYRPYRGVTGTNNHGYVSNNDYRGNSNRNNFSGYRGNRTNRNNTNKDFSGYRNNNRNNNNFNTQRPSYNTNNTGSFGGSRSSGSFGGGGGSRGGGGGGGSFGGRR